MSDSWRPRGLQHVRLPCPPPSPRVCSSSCPLCQWCYLTSLIFYCPLLLLPPIFPSIRVLHIHTYACINESLCCTPEINTSVVNQLYSSKKNIHILGFSYTTACLSWTWVWEPLSNDLVPLSLHFSLMTLFFNTEQFTKVWKRECPRVSWPQKRDWLLSEPLLVELEVV